MGWSFYISTIIAYLGVDLMAAWALNMQFGWTGIPNFAFIIFQAIGAYAVAVLTLGPDTGANAYQHYIAGMNLPFPVPLLVAGAAGGGLAVVIGLISLRRFRRDYQAAVLLLIALIATEAVSGDVSLFNGANGLANIPPAISGALGQSPWFMVGVIAIACLLTLAVVRRLGRSGWQRGLRAIRDDEDAAVALGLNSLGMRLEVFVLGGVIAGISGGLLVEVISAWSPGSWGYAETFAILTGIILGGLANDWGVLVGTFVVQILFVEAPNFLPQIGYPGLIDSLEWVLVGLLWIVVLAVRPRGIIPERRQRMRTLAPATDSVRATGLVRTVEPALEGSEQQERQVAP